MIKKVFYLFDSEAGVTSIEYAIMASLIAVVIVLAVTALGSRVESLYQLVVSALP